MAAGEIIQPDGTTGGGATAARQDTGNTALSSIDGKTPALGQALAAASSPVVLTAAQVTTLMPPPAITGYALEATQLLQATAANQVTELASLTTIATDVAPFVSSTAGAYMRQDVTATIAKEQGGNLDLHGLTLSLMLVELRLLRQAFQDWTGTDPRLDTSAIPLPLRLQ